MICEHSKLTHLYHDGELPAEQRPAFESHLRECEACREALDDLRRMSRLFAKAVARALPPERLEHLLLRRVKAEDPAVLRIAGWFTATAAGILLAAVLSWPADRPEPADPPDVWAGSSMMAMIDVDESFDSDLLAVAQWMADDLASLPNGELR